MEKSVSLGFQEYLEEMFHVKAEDVRMYPPLTLAYIGAVSYTHLNVCIPGCVYPAFRSGSGLDEDAGERVRDEIVRRRERTGERKTLRCKRRAYLQP